MWFSSCLTLFAEILSLGNFFYLGFFVKLAVYSCRDPGITAMKWCLQVGQVIQTKCACVSLERKMLPATFTTWWLLVRRELLPFAVIFSLPHQDLGFTVFVLICVIMVLHNCFV